MCELSCRLSEISFPLCGQEADFFPFNCLPSVSFILFSVSPPYLLLPSFPLPSLGCSFVPLQFLHLSSPLSSFPSPHPFKIIQGCLGDTSTPCPFRRAWDPA